MNDQAFIDRLVTFWHEEGLRPVTTADVRHIIPYDEILAHFPTKHYWPTPLGEVRAYYDLEAPYRDWLSMSNAELEIASTRVLTELLARHNPGNVIDAGCGTGLTLTFLALTYPHILFLGYDLSSACTAIARQRVARRHLPNIRLLTSSHGHAHTLLGEEVTDVVFTKNALDLGPFLTAAPAHQRRIKDHLRSIATLLRSGGRYLELAAYRSSKDFEAVRQLATNLHLHRVPEESQILHNVLPTHLTQQGRLYAITTYQKR